MTLSSKAWSGQDIHPGTSTRVTMMESIMLKRMKKKMSKFISARKAEADVMRYRKYSDEKSKIPMNLPPKEYEAEIKRLARKYKI